MMTFYCLSQKENADLGTSPICQTSSKKRGHKWKTGAIGCHLNTVFIQIQHLSHYILELL